MSASKTFLKIYRHLLLLGFSPSHTSPSESAFSLHILLSTLKKFPPIISKANLIGFLATGIPSIIIYTSYSTFMPQKFVKNRNIVYFEFWDVSIFFKGFCGFFCIIRKASKIEKIGKHIEACNQGCLGCPLEARTGAQGIIKDKETRGMEWMLIRLDTGWNNWWQGGKGSPFKDFLGPFGRFHGPLEVFGLVQVSIGLQLASLFSTIGLFGIFQVPLAISRKNEKVSMYLHVMSLFFCDIPLCLIIWVSLMVMVVGSHPRIYFRKKGFLLNIVIFILGIIVNYFYLHYGCLALFSRKLKEFIYQISVLMYTPNHSLSLSPLILSIVQEINDTCLSKPPYQSVISQPKNSHEPSSKQIEHHFWEGLPDIPSFLDYVPGMTASLCLSVGLPAPKKSAEIIQTQGGVIWVFEKVAGAPAARNPKMAFFFLLLKLVEDFSLPRKINLDRLILNSKLKIYTNRKSFNVYLPSTILANCQVQYCCCHQCSIWFLKFSGSSTILLHHSLPSFLHPKMGELTPKPQDYKASSLGLFSLSACIYIPGSVKDAPSPYTVPQPGSRIPTVISWFTWDKFSFSKIIH
ncbi:putative signal peptide protein [Puccinia sorghi]|uniref:Putative signal peptide protein n=1 Tax=Puccinia sorghi TaxID=27349 RepID=A0A0L6U5A1_9BASI|nr:putative signal peptide protein [Puccinia sorghi]